MPIPQSPSATTVPVMRHKSYFIHEADVTFRVEDHVFRVHKYFFTRESSYFRRLLEPSQFLAQDPPGSSESDPVVLEGISSNAFACFLWVFYNPKYSVYEATPQQWAMIIDLAQKWGFKEVELLCIRELEKMDLSPVDRIHIYHKFGLETTLLIDSYASLTTRDQPIGLEEGMKLGLRTSLQIAQAREMSRGPDTGGGLRSPSAVQLDGPHLHTLLEDIFGLPRIMTSGIAHGGPMTMPEKYSDKPDRASGLPATAPTTPSKPGALSKSTSNSDEHPPTNDNANMKPPPLTRLDDIAKQNRNARKYSNKS